MSPSAAAWKDVGEMLQDRRVELDTRYSNRQLFADERGINYRLAWDVEKGARSNFSRPVLTSIEVAYGLARGSFMQAVLGGEFVAAPGTPPVERRVSRVLRALSEDADGDENRSSGTG